MSWMQTLRGCKGGEKRHKGGQNGGKDEKYSFVYTQSSFGR